MTCHDKWRRDAMIDVMEWSVEDLWLCFWQAKAIPVSGLDRRRGFQNV